MYDNAAVTPFSAAESTTYAGCRLGENPGAPAISDNSAQNQRLSLEWQTPDEGEL
jgi:hypothetical protein